MLDYLALLGQRVGCSMFIPIGLLESHTEILWRIRWHISPWTPPGLGRTQRCGFWADTTPRGSGFQPAPSPSEGASQSQCCPSRRMGTNSQPPWMSGTGHSAGGGVHQLGWLKPLVWRPYHMWTDSCQGISNYTNEFPKVVHDLHLWAPVAKNIL